MSAQALLDKISNIESELQKLKLEAYFQLPKKPKIESKYSEQLVLNAVKTTRNKIWQKRYAKKV